MTPSRLIDFHTHPFPDAGYGERWQRAVGHEPRRPGTIEQLVSLMDAGRIERAVILLFPRSKERYAELVAQDRRSEAAARREIVEEIRWLNQWGCLAAEAEPRLIPFVGINPRYMTADEIRAEIDESVARGAKGVKVIPPSMEMYGDDPSLWAVFERCSALGIPVLSQSGSGGGDPPAGRDHYGRPRYYAAALEAFPRLTLVLAHLGLGYEADIVDLTARYPNVYTDTSLRLSRLGAAGHWTAQELVDYIRRVGVERVLFGSNFPMTDPAAYAETLRSLPLTDDERERLAWGTANEVLTGGIEA